MATNSNTATAASQGAIIGAVEKGASANTNIIHCYTTGSLEASQGASHNVTNFYNNATAETVFEGFDFVNVWQAVEGGTPVLRVFLAHEEPEYFTVNFVTNSDDSIPPQSILKGQKVAEPQAPQKDYYIFDGWYTEQYFTNKWSFESDTVTENITLYAKWKQEFSDEEMIGFLSDYPVRKAGAWDENMLLNYCKAYYGIEDSAIDITTLLTVNVQHIVRSE